MSDESDVIGHGRRRFLVQASATTPKEQDPELSLQDKGQSITTTTTSPTQFQSSLTLLEHVNLNVPNHDKILDFYFRVLGCGLDPRKASNLRPTATKKTIWANAGATQFHLPYGDVGQAIRGHIGLRLHDLEALRLALER
eukprot:CAMPEP_0168761208 /NCGR_PEP_ID=MMETSP0724-20121128/23193_1 /TAXON_ID=265536 /ORGANISM="Amphiprora sp., Strain CCMP467" /LENGTH=139 /DNA_ID=CAMNT_0008810301 /DNA_START=41 /DNA_END=457 /DNA_ORIENTATION=+